jgi:hypothetical protein
MTKAVSIPAVLSLAMAIAACSSPTRGSAISLAPVWPNEPAGFAPLTDQPWNDLSSGKWERRSNTYDRIVADSSAPLSPDSVLEYVYPTGFAGGKAPATHFFPLDNTKEIFVGLEWKASSGWQGHASGVNKVQFLYLAGSDDVAMVMFGRGDGAYELRVLPQWPEHQSSWLTANSASRPIVPGQWHRLEWHLKYESRYGAGDGVIRWWVDGVLAGDYANVRYPNDAGIVENQMSPTWGGVGDTKRRMDSYRFDHSYISAPASVPQQASIDRSILFREDFEDDRLQDRGWYDIAHWGDQLVISSAQARSGRSSLEVRYPSGSTGPWLRRQFQPHDRIYTRYYRKWPSHWVWAPEAGPHDTYLFAMRGQQWFTPTSTYLTVYTESGYAGAPRGQKGTIGLDIARVLQSEGDRALTSLVPPPPPFELDRWHCIETLATMNTAGRKDGRVQLWLDGRLVFDAGGLLLRDEAHAPLKFDAFMFGPYFHSGTPQAQSTWIDALVVATTRVRCLT